MGIDIDLYRARIGSFGTKVKQEQQRHQGTSNATLEIFVGIIIGLLLVIGNIEINPGPSDNQDKILTILCELKLAQEKNTRELKNFEKSLNIKHSEIEKNLTDLKQANIALKKTQEAHQKLLRNLELSQRRNNLVFFGISEVHREYKWDTSLLIRDVIARFLGINLSEDSIHDVLRLGKGYNRPILIKFNSIITRDYVLSRRNKLKGTRIRIDEDFDLETRNNRQKLLPFLKDARSQGLRAYLKKDKLWVDGKIYDLQNCKDTFGLPNQSSGGIRRSRSFSLTNKNNSGNRQSNDLGTEYADKGQELGRRSSMEKILDDIQFRDDNNSFNFIGPGLAHSPNREVSDWHPPVRSISSCVMESTRNMESTRHQEPPSQAKGNTTISARETSHSNHHSSTHLPSSGVSSSGQEPSQKPTQGKENKTHQYDLRTYYPNVNSVIRASKRRNK